MSCRDQDAGGGQSSFAGSQSTCDANQVPDSQPSPVLGAPEEDRRSAPALAMDPLDSADQAIVSSVDVLGVQTPPNPAATSSANSTPRPAPPIRPTAQSPQPVEPRQGPCASVPSPTILPAFRPASRFATPHVILRRPSSRNPQPPTWTLGEFLTAATRNLYTALPNPVKRARRPGINFSSCRGRSTRTKATNASAPPTAERRT